MANTRVVTDETMEMVREMTASAMSHRDIPERFCLGNRWERTEYTSSGWREHTLWVTLRGAPSRVRSSCVIDRAHPADSTEYRYKGTVTITLVDTRSPQTTYAFECRFADEGVQYRQVLASNV